MSFYSSWYLFVVITNFDYQLQLWINAVVIAVFVGIALNASVEYSNFSRMNVRLFIIPFAVSSYTGIVRGNDFFLIFPPDPVESVFGLICCVLVVTGYYLYLVKSNG
ncbi:MAG: hypothetical protein AAGA66_04295 [Bacteroidota bacterium]